MHLFGLQLKATWTATAPALTTPLHQTPTETGTSCETSAKHLRHICERFLPDIVQNRSLLEAISDAASPISPQPRPANTLVPFASAADIPDSAAAGAELPDAIASKASSPQMQSAEDVVFCVEDTVGLKDDKYSVGLVERSFGDVDSHEPRPQSDYPEDIERHPDIPVLAFAKFIKDGIPPRGTVLVSWQTQYKTELVPEAKLQLLDRALYVGDVVKRRAEDHMSGTVIGSKESCTLFPASQFNGGQITQATTDNLSIRNIPADELINVHEYVEGALVVYGDWVGRVENVYDEVAVRLSNNSVVVVEDPAELEQDDATMPIERLSVGDTFKTKKGNLRRGRWKFGAYDPSIQPVGTVVETRVTEMDVQWLARSIGARNIAFAADEPPATLGRDEFESPDFYKYDASGGTATVLPVLENGVDRSYHVADVAVGDRVRFKDIAGAAVKYDGTHTLPTGHPQGKVTRVARTESLGYDLNVFLVMQTHSHVTVQWQDLSITNDLSSSLLPDPNVEDDDEVWPGEIVFSKEGREGEPAADNDARKPLKVGVVQTVKGRDRIATVRWFKNPSVEFFGPDLLPPATTGELHEAIEDVSLYDIYSNTALTRRRGDFVLVHPNSIEGVETPLNVTGPDWFGEVIDLGLDGRLTIRLGAAKPVVDVKVPYEGVTLAYSSDMADEYLNNMEELDGDSITDSEDSAFDSESFNEMWIEYEGMDGEHPVGDEGDWSTEDEDDEEDGNDDNDDSSMPDLIDITKGPDTSNTTPENKSPATQEAQADAQTVTENVTSPIKEDTPDLPTEGPAPFLILDTPPPASHHYLEQSSASSSAFMRRIAKEHKILRSSLPQGIFVRTWESRLDLLRVLMIGPSDTPYEYAPFVIDFHLPSNYPQQAPEAFFHSWTQGNGPVNPNLYEDGKICLSLLGTWHTDERNESWSPAKSTLLQVLVSIMGLVLVKEPYYNEAGYDVHRSAPETKLSSALYTERAYFRARAFIHHALTNDVAPFKEELEYLYQSKEDGAPKLLDQAIEAAKDIVDRSVDGSEEGERDGLRRISLGALVMLKRQVEKLEALKQAAAQA
jgi:ubiquitin-conjugating enzyme E2 O